MVGGRGEEEPGRGEGLHQSINHHISPSNQSFSLPIVFYLDQMDQLAGSCHGHGLNREVRVKLKLKMFRVKSAR